MRWCAGLTGVYIQAPDVCIDTCSNTPSDGGLWRYSGFPLPMSVLVTAGIMGAKCNLNDVVWYYYSLKYALFI